MKSDDFLGRQNRPIICMGDDRFWLADFIGRQNRANFIDRLTSRLHESIKHLLMGCRYGDVILLLLLLAFGCLLSSCVFDLGGSM